MAALPSDHDNFFRDHLSYFAGARTNPYAIQIASEICKGFKLSVAGQRRLNKALNDLPCVDTADPGLAFGWSWDHIIRSSRVHSFGYEHLTIVVTLAECFHETYAAEVFHHLARQVLPASQSTPHVYQWLDLLHFCNGILANDEFSLVVENFIQLNPYSVTPGGKYSSDRCLVPPHSVAAALIALSELTCGERDKLSLRGGGVVGWLAALAEQFFDLTVTIKSKEGNHLHGPEGNAKLLLIYTEKSELVIEEDSLLHPAGEVTSLSLAPLSRQIHFLPYGGRVTWTTLFHDVFGQSFHDLDRTHSKAMFTAIGTAFRAIEGAKDSSSIHPKQGPHASLASHPLEASASQLISTLTTFLSSLQHGQGRMERQLKLTPQEAAKSHLDQIHFLVSVCQCTVCSRATDRASSTPGDNGKDGDSDPHPAYCLPSIVSTIIVIGLMLPRIVLTHPIRPSREGVQLLYKLRSDKFFKTNDHNIMSPSPNIVASLYDNVLTAQTSYILRMAVKFFAGGHLPPLGSDLLPAECVAIAHEGICAFAAEFASGRNVKKDMRGMVRIINGGFGIKQKTYQLAAWCSSRPGGREGWQWEYVEVEHLRDSNDGRLWLK